MPDSYRGRLFTAVTAFFVATVGVLTILAIWDGAASYTQHRLQAQHYAAEYAAEAQERIEQCATLASGPDIAICVGEVIQAAREDQRGERDLAAQRDMAKWAGWLLVASGAGVWITLAGVIYVALTLQATRAAVAAANRTADEAKRIGEAQVRAYINVSQARMSLVEMGRNRMWLIPQFEILVMNSGNSPAQNLQFYFEISFMTKGGVWMVARAKSSGSGRTNVAPNSQEKCHRFAGGARFGELADITLANGTFAPLVRISIEYKDVFDAVQTASGAFTFEFPAGDGLKPVKGKRFEYAADVHFSGDSGQDTAIDPLVRRSRHAKPEGNGAT